MIQIEAFGPWRMSVDGRVTGSLPSRSARELLLYMSLHAGPWTRERLVTVLGGGAGEAAWWRRRLSQELNRIQHLIGDLMWESSRDLVALQRRYRLASDVADLVAGAHPGAGIEDSQREWVRRHRLVLLAGRGEILPGHTSDWVEHLRSTIRQDEARLLRLLASEPGSPDDTATLACARRWAEREPFADRAQAALLRWLARTHGTAAAREQLGLIEQRYQQELAIDPGPEVYRELDPQPAREQPVLQRLIRESEAACRAAVDDLARVLTLLTLDDHLRLAGRHDRRAAVHDMLARLPHDGVGLAWRRADLSLAQLDLRGAASLMAEACPAAQDCQDLPAVTAGLVHFHKGDLAAAESALLAAIHSTDRAAVVIEANLRLWDVYECRHDLVSAENAVLRACEEAERRGWDHYRAWGLALLGWSRIRAHDHAQAEQYLHHGRRLNQRVGSDLVRALVLGGLGHVYFNQHRYGSALRSMDEAATIAERGADLRSVVRWRRNACMAAYGFGDVASMRRHLDSMVAVLDHGTDPRLTYKVLSIQGAILERSGEFESAIATASDASREATAAGDEGYAFHEDLGIVRLLMELGRLAEAVDTARRLAAHAERMNFPPPTRLNAAAHLGAALVAHGQPAAGIPSLRQAASAGHAGVLPPPYVTYWLHRAATMLGLEQEATAAQIRARRYVELFRSDLSDGQWAVATANVPDLCRLATLLSPSHSQVR
ncbi:hypothetical protein ACN27F_31980 [Solwaraspora sp. WMMB335]|uniref:hypothetical protein n=1 Tax=Solwaraspora sp. WMMB335 TaxID=3404118 RepID=UPI003B935076